MTALPRPGEVYWLTLTVGVGHEQAGRRPVLVVTDERLAVTGLVWVVPLTSTDRGWPLQVTVKVGGRRSVAMCEQLRAVAVERLKGRLGSVPFQDLTQVKGVLRNIIGH